MRKTVKKLIKANKNYYLTILTILFIFIFCIYQNAHRNSPQDYAIYYWNNNKFRLAPDLMPKSHHATAQGTVDVDGDSILEKFSLNNGRLTIYKDSKTIWKSPSDWQIDSYFIADSTNDGTININLSLWKPGNFGTSKPFWVEKNDMSIKNHFFVYDLVDNEMIMNWGSSNLAKPNCEFQTTDIDNDGKNDLIVIEGEYQNDTSCSGEYIAVWKWGSWGFVNEWRSEKGNYKNLRIEDHDDKKYIVTDNK